MNLIGLKDLRLKIDKYAKLVNKTKESYLVTRKGKPLFRLSPIDSDDQWETVVDFTEISKDGVDINDVLKALKNLSK